ncbi:MAG: electron transfer flavoprotein subunit alpha/FixB family protein, partial [Aeromicrobium sp.]
MSEVLVLVEHVDGTVTKPTLELLTIARRLGEPSAVFFGSEVEAAKPALAEFGAAKIYHLDDAAYGEFLVVPKAEA